MSIYTVHIPAADLDRPLAVSRAVFVREGFQLGRVLFRAPVVRRPAQLLGLFLWCAAMAAMAGMAKWLAISPLAVFAGEFLLHVLFGLEAAQLRRRSLARRNYFLPISSRPIAEARQS